MLLHSMPLAPATKALLAAGGFTHAREVLECRVTALADELQISSDAAARMQRAVLHQVTAAAATTEAKEGGASPSSPAPLDGAAASSATGDSDFTGPCASEAKRLSAAAAFKREQKSCSIVTFCRDLDDLLGGGVQAGTMTEVCGEPGTGKTQLAMQLAVDCQVPRSFGGAEGEAIYIDTEGSFHVARVAQIAQAMMGHLGQLVSAKGGHNNPTTGTLALGCGAGAGAGSGENDATSLRADLKKLTLDAILSRIHYFRVHSYAEQLAVLRQLPRFIDAHNKQASRFF